MKELKVTIEVTITCKTDLSEVKTKRSLEHYLVHKWSDDKIDGIDGEVKGIVVDVVHCEGVTKLFK